MIEALLERTNYPEFFKDQYFIPGFDVKKEVGSLSKHFNALQVEMNIRSYIREYAKQGLVLPNLIDLSADRKLVNLTGIPIVPGITVEERNGSVLEASFKAEKFLAEGLPSSFVVITSPKGQSGMRDSRGEMIEYPMTQTLVYWKEMDGHLNGVTLVSDLDKEQNKELLKRLGVNDAVLHGINEMEDLAQIVRNPALLGPNLHLSAEKVVDEILSIRGLSDIVLEKPGGELEHRSVSEYKRDLERRDTLLKYNQDAEAYIENFRNFMLMNMDNLDSVFIQRRLEDELRKTILKITGTLEEFRVSRMNLEIPHFTRNDSYGMGDEFGGVMAFLQTKIGCNGSGSSNVRILMGGSTQGGIISLESSLSGKCSKCGINHAVFGGCGYCHECGDEKAA